MATVSGIAAGGADDLWGILLAFLGANGWHTLDTGSSVSGNVSVQGVQLRGEDVSGTGSIYVHLVYWKNVMTDVYSLQMEGSAGWNPEADVLQFGQNPQNSYRDLGTSTSVIVRTPLHGAPIQYWITASPRRFMGAFRHNDRWGSLYCGFVMPYGMPSQWAYPLWIAGNNIATDDYKEALNGCPWGASAVVSGMLYCPSGRWQATPNYQSPPGGRGFGVQMWPYLMQPGQTYIRNYVPLEDRNGVRTYPVTNMLFWCANANEYGLFGEPDGLCHVTSWGAAGGDLLTKAGRTYLLIQREMSAANDTSAAMLLE
ncbi:MAG: hypothetical protein LBW85_01150 [Deltaproteobacteria bacterium]|jgi:hypothetical protein|nr:hypothetical protein [Deltaproteobacteria bacterium]